MAGEYRNLEWMPTRDPTEGEIRCRVNVRALRMPLEEAIMAVACELGIEVEAVRGARPFAGRDGCE